MKTSVKWAVNVECFESVWYGANGIFTSATATALSFLLRESVNYSTALEKILDKTPFLWVGCKEKGIITPNTVLALHTQIHIQYVLISKFQVFKPGFPIRFIACVCVWYMAFSGFHFLLK